MALGNYTDFVAAVESWLIEPGATAVIPDWIALLESEINRKLRAQPQETTAILTVSSALTAFPTDFMEWRRLRHASSPYEKLDLVGEDWASDHYQTIATGRPKQYLNEANQLRMIPQPDTSYDLTVTYYVKVPALTSLAPTNWLLTNYPDIYLFGTLSKSKGYLGSDERIAGWEASYMEALGSLIRSDQRARWSGSTPTPRVRVAP